DPAFQRRADRDRRDPAGHGDDLRCCALRLDLRQAARREMIDNVIFAAIVMTTPVLLAAIGGLVNRVGGIVNIGLDSMMLAGALAGLIVASATGSWLPALAAAAVVGAVLGLLMSLAVTRLEANEIIVGLGFN